MPRALDKLPMTLEIHRGLPGAVLTSLLNVIHDFYIESVKTPAGFCFPSAYDLPLIPDTVHHLKPVCLSV